MGEVLLFDSVAGPSSDEEVWISGAAENTKQACSVRIEWASFDPFSRNKVGDVVEIPEVAVSDVGEFFTVVHEREVVSSFIRF